MHAKRMRCVTLSCGLFESTAFYHATEETKIVFLFPLQSVSATFLIPRRNERDTTINVYWSLCKVAIIFVRFLMKLEFSGQIFGIFSNIKFHENPSIGNRTVQCGRTDRQTNKQT
jgi:hypothetical protein